MTIREAIDRVDGLKPNGYSIEDKVRWLAVLDAQITEDVINNHYLNEDEKVYDEYGICINDVPRVLEAYTTDDMDKKLLVSYPYDDLYVDYLKMKIDNEDGETMRYNNSLTMFEASYGAFAKTYNKHHRPNGVSHLMLR